MDLPKHPLITLLVGVLWLGGGILALEFQWQSQPWFPYLAFAAFFLNIALLFLDSKIPRSPVAERLSVPVQLTFFAVAFGSFLIVDPGMPQPFKAIIIALVVIFAGNAVYRLFKPKKQRGGELSSR